MNAQIVFGLFALYVATASLYMVLSGQQDAVLALLRRFWGRTVGHSLYFITRVALPLLICVLCLGWGVRHFDTTVSFHQPAVSLELNVEYYRQLLMLSEQDKVLDPGGVVYGA